MKNWLIRFRLSAALDAGQPLPPSLERAAARSGEARQFSESLQRLDKTLRASVPRNAAPPMLHGSIMRAVRAASRTPALAPQPQAVPLRLIWAAAAALALVFSGVWWGQRAPLPPDLSASASLTRTAALTEASDAVTLSEHMVRTAPTATLAPLDDEWQRINRDIEAGAKTLLASVP